MKRSSSSKQMVSSSKGRRNIESDDTLFTSQYVKSFTPRSKEACKMLGVMPKELILRSFESFDKPGLTPEIARLRYKDYEQLRQETIHMVRQQRRDLVQSGWQPISKTKQRGKNGQQMVLYSSRSTSSLRRPGTTTLEMEQARMNKIMARQNKEIEAMMVYEVKMAELLSRQEKKLAFRKHREEEEREKRKMERYKVAEKRRLWEIAKKEDEEREAKKREAAALLLLEQERRRDMELQRLEEDRKKQAKKKQAERRKKKIMLEKRTQQILEAQLAMMEIKNREMQERDLIRKQNIEEKKAEMEALHLEKTRRARARVVSVLEDKERKLEEKRQALYKKMDKQQRRMDDFEQQKRDQALARLKQGQLREEQRSQSRLDSQLKEQRRITDILDKKMMHERHKFELDKKRRDEMEFRQEMLRLNRKRKQMNVDRLKRMENYKRLMLVEKVNEDAQRTRELELQKQKLIRDRQTNRIMVTRQKQGLVEMFEKIKLQRNWNQLNNLLTGGEDSDEEGGMDSGRMHSGRRTPAGKRNRDKGGMGAGGLSKSNSAATLKEFFSRMSASQSTASLNSAKKPTKGRRRR